MLVSVARRKEVTRSRSLSIVACCLHRCISLSFYDRSPWMCYYALILKVLHLFTNIYAPVRFVAESFQHHAQSDTSRTRPLYCSGKGCSVTLDCLQVRSQLNDQRGISLSSNFSTFFS